MYLVHQSNIYLSVCYAFYMCIDQSASRTVFCLQVSYKNQLTLALFIYNKHTCKDKSCPMSSGSDVSLFSCRSNTLRMDTHEMFALERNVRQLCAWHWCHRSISLTFKVAKAPVQQPLGTSDLRSFPWRINTCNESGNCCQKSVCFDQQ